MVRVYLALTSPPCGAILEVFLEGLSAVRLIEWLVDWLVGWLIDWSRRLSSLSLGADVP